MKKGVFLEIVRVALMCIILEKEAFDRYGRALVYLSDGQETYNLRLIEAGYAIPGNSLPWGISCCRY